MNLFDTHCHFESASVAAIEPILKRAAAGGVTALMAVGGSPLLNASACAAARLAAGRADLPRVLCALGFDREQAGGRTDLSALPDFSPVAAVGEIGLDYHYSPETREAQLKLFASELERARSLDLPVIIHTREADDDTLALIREIPSRGIIHSYTGTAAAARAFLDLGFFISFSGIVTFKAAANVRSVARAVPDDRILIETDSPYLAPVPLRGRPNEPAFVVHTCAFLAAERGKNAADFAALTHANAVRCLSKPKAEIQDE